MTDEIIIFSIPSLTCFMAGIALVLYYFRLKNKENTMNYIMSL